MKKICKKKAVIFAIAAILLFISSVQGINSVDINVNEDITKDYDMLSYETPVSFSQLDWYYHGNIHTLNSMWGRMDIVAEPDSSFWYMNVVAYTECCPAWIIQNYPIFPVEYGVPNEQVIYFNIEDLGLSEGMPLLWINAAITYDLYPQETEPLGEPYAYEVATSIRDAWGHNPSEVQPVGTPKGHKAIGEVVKENITKHTNIPGVQECENNCITGAYARSIKWLDNENNLENLPDGTSAQDIYDHLNESGVGHGSGEGKTEEEMLEIKAAYLKGLDSRAVTKFVDLTDWMSDNVTGCIERTPANLKDWIESELKRGEDIELCYDSHCVTITGIYTQGNKTFLEYRDDEHQGNDSVGDSAEKEGELIQTVGGWSFDGSGIDYVVSESIIDNNNPPHVPIDPVPDNRAIDIPVDINLGWTGGDPDIGDIVTYDVYFGTCYMPPKVAGNQLAMFYNPGILDCDTKYYWKIVAWDNHGAFAEGPLWDFTTTSDEMPPVTNCTLEGDIDGDIYISNVTVTLTAIDDISGVNYTIYKVDNGSYINYVEPFIISDDGNHVVYYYSIDNAENVEDEKNCTFTIEQPSSGIRIKSISSGFGVSAVIENVGSIDAIDVEWGITLSNGFILLGSDTTGTVDVTAGEEVTVYSNLIFGFGNAIATVTAGNAEESSNAIVILFFVFLY